MSWLADASANRINKAYIQNFFDLSGNFKVRNAITSSSSGSSSSSSEPDYQKNAVFYGDSSSQWYGWYVDFNLAGDKAVVAARNSSGHARVYKYENDSWSEEGRLYHSSNASFACVAMNGDGTIVMGTVPSGNKFAVFEFDSATNTWSRTAENTSTTSEQLSGGDMSRDGSTIVIGNYKSSNGPQYMFSYANGTITSNGMIQNTDGCAISPTLSQDGSRVTYSSLFYSSSRGALRIYDNTSGTTWTQVGSTIIGPIAGGRFGQSSCISGDGNTVVIGAHLANIAYVYEYVNGNWSMKGSPLNDYFSSSYNTLSFGVGVKISDDGSTIMVNDHRYNSSAGAVWVFRFIDNDWQQVGFITPDNETAGQSFFGYVYGVGLGMDEDGSVLGAGSHRAKSATGLSQAGLVNFYHDVNAPSGSSVSYESKDIIDVSGGTVSIWYNTMDISSGFVDISGTSWINRGQSGASVSSAYQCGLVIESSGTSASNSVIHVETAGQTQAFSIRENGDLYSDNALQYSSDDRRKIDEQHITNATETLLKLSPQIYTKLDKFEEDGGTPTKTESGLIAQEVYYNAPELRHLVSIITKDCYGRKRVPIEYDLSNNRVVETSTEPIRMIIDIDASGNPVFETIERENTSSEEYNIQQDPNYTVLGWGKKSATVDYIGLIPYLIKSNQEQDALIKERQTSIDEQAQLIQQFQNRVTALENK
jgi:hypothetical protein